MTTAYADGAYADVLALLEQRRAAEAEIAAAAHRNGKKQQAMEHRAAAYKYAQVMELVRDLVKQEAAA